MQQKMLDCQKICKVAIFANLLLLHKFNDFANFSPSKARLLHKTTALLLGP